MARYSLNLPEQLKRDAERWAASQGVSLNQFVLWAVAEKVGGLGRELDDPEFPGVTYRRGGAGEPTPVVRGTRLRVRTLAVAAGDWGWEPERIAEEFGLTEKQVKEGLEFARHHQKEIAADLAAEAELEAAGA
ncbi:MAG TPA: DUF433 domain-containing protein [Thermoanaerobaculia bacterium]|nr:DUF433 domain-containing protein [Thermoanaerobaculia bacterium]